MPNPQSEPNTGEFDSDQFVKSTVANLRTRLLDLTTRNPLISFKHSARTRRFIRVIDELPDHLYARLQAESPMRFKSLGDEVTEPADEKTILFRRAFDAAKLEEDEYREQLEALGDEPGERAVNQLEDALRARLRERLGMPPRRPIAVVTAQEVARQRGLDPEFELPAGSAEVSSAVAAKHTDTWIQTLLFDEPLERTSSRIRDHVRLSIDEAGVNPLFCVFGFLEWYEDANSTTPLYAPLLLCPLEVDRELVRGHYQYTVKSTGESPFINVALLERLKRDFEIELPPFDEDTGTPEGYLKSIQKIIESHRAWKVRRWVTIGLFSFAKIAMYQDLDPERWQTGGGLHTHPPLCRIVGGMGGGGGSTDDRDDAGRDELREIDVPLIADADYSQLNAVRDVMSGRSLVIMGPPGTGKSQTITNIIAAALSKGQSVLFLAEKMVALNVVKDRLREAQLDQFCLELHSTKASRKEVFAGLARRLNCRPGQSVDAELSSTLARLESTRKRLRDCVEGLAKPAGNLGVTTHTLLWACHRLREKTRDLPTDVDGLLMEEAGQLTKVDVGHVVSTAEQFELARSLVVRSYGSPRNNPWYGLAHHEIDPFRAEDAVRRVAGVARAAERAEKALNAVTSLTGVQATSSNDLALVAGSPGIAPPELRADDELIGRMSDPQTLAALEDFAADVAEYRSLLESTAPQFADPVALGACSPDMLNALERAGRDAAFGDVAVSECPALSQQRQRQAAGWRNVAALIESAFDLSGLQSPLTAEAERSLLVAIDLAREAEALPADSRTPATVAPGAAAVLKRGLERAAELRGRRESLSKEYAVDASPDAAVLRAHAAALRAARMIPIFDGGWWRARAAFKVMRRAKGKERSGGMAAAFDLVATLKEDLTAFEQDLELSRRVGPLFRDVDSNLADPLRAATWAVDARSRLSTAGRIGVHLTELLFTASPELVKALAQLSQSPHLPNLKQVLVAPANRSRTIAVQAQDADARARAALKAVDLLAPIRLRPTFMLSHCDALAASLTRINALRDSLDRSVTAANALGTAFAGHRTATDSLIESARYVRDVGAAPIGVGIRNWLLASNARERLTALEPVAREGIAAYSSIDAAVKGLADLIPVDFKMWIGVTSALDARASELGEHARRCVQDAGGLQILIDDARCVHEARAVGLGPLIELLESRRLPISDFGNSARRLIYQSVARTMIANNPALASFTGDRHEALRKEFCKLDRQLKVLRRAKIAGELLARRIDPGNDYGPKRHWSGRALIANETEKQQRHISTRDLLDRAGKAVQQLTPCFMMSPSSVAQFLTPEGLKFDLVVMDEASQLRPQDAVGAIARSAQVVIVGDPKQLPPTSFFMGSDGAVDDDQDGTAVTEASILDQAIAILRPTCPLQWHYRSLHPSLIAYSNQEFYSENPLILFPSPYHDRPDYGLKYVHVPLGVFGGRVNSVEAQLVAAAVVEYAAQHPDRSIGVVTFNQPQAERISAEMDQLESQDETFAAWRRKWEHSLEGFFVKNLENVQGDERDVIFISTVYGRDAQGNFHQRFGPINNEGGHRRLNVLFTRAKRQMLVYSSMDPSDIRVDPTSKWGVRALKGFLRFAKDGVLHDAKPTGRAPDSDFEIAVADTLRASNFEVEPQLGVAGYFIDMAVRHPVTTGEFVLGVECDGAMYHSAKNVRDRDRLRQEVLERLGWRIHRIWSLDWYRNPIRERERLMNAVREAVAMQG